MKEAKIPYWQKLQDPRWQRKRLEIMQRDEFSCVVCYNESSQLQVHHRWYVSGREPWEYPDCALQTLCNACHTDNHPDYFEDTIQLVEAVTPHFVDDLKCLGNTKLGGMSAFQILDQLLMLIRSGTWTEGTFRKGMADFIEVSKRDSKLKQTTKG